ncbi:MAG: trans-aconitate 2-methyltransferase, partial [Halobacteriaceae archaeon]
VREGAAHATGVDFAPRAIETARELRDRVGLTDRARFVERDVLTLDLDETFPVVVTTYGTIYWLPDLEPWAETVAAHLDPGGTFYIADGHPFAALFGYGSTADDLRVEFPYFEGEPITESFDGSYAGEGFGLDSPTSHGFAHPVGAIVTALVEAGLHIEFLHEFPWSFFQRFEAMEEDGGRWYLPGLEYDLPFTFSLKATMPK